MKRIQQLLCPMTKANEPNSTALVSYPEPVIQSQCSNQQLCPITEPVQHHNSSVSYAVLPFSLASYLSKLTMLLLRPFHSKVVFHQRKQLVLIVIIANEISLLPHLLSLL